MLQTEEIREYLLQVLRTAPVGTGLPITEITTEIMKLCGGSTPDFNSLKDRVSWLASQKFKPEGLVKSYGRGVWGLPTGEEGDTPVGVQVETQIVHTASHLQVEDPYIHSLLISQTPCFGHLTETDPVCSTCSLRAFCCEKLYATYRTLAEQLLQEETAPKGKTAPMMGESIEDILAELEGEAQAQPPEWTELKATIESVCQKCHKTIQEDEVGWYKIGDFRHKTCI